MNKRFETWKKTRFSEKEEQILEGFLDVAIKEGVENVTLQKVAHQAKTPYATVHYYFGKSEFSLLENALIYVGIASEKFIEETMSELLKKSNENTVEAYITAKFIWNEKFPKYASLWCYFIYQATRDKESLALHAEFMESNTARMKTFLLLEMGKGTYTKLKNVEALADKIYQAIMGAMILGMSTSRTPKSLKERKEATFDIVQTLIDKHSKQFYPH